MLAKDAVAALGEDEADAFLTRVEVSLVDVHEPLAVLYGAGRATRSSSGRCAPRWPPRPNAPPTLRRLDRRREIDPAWFQRARMQGYVCYVDRFCGTLAGCRTTSTTSASSASPTCT